MIQPRPILTVPDARLRRMCAPVTTFDASLRLLVDELAATMVASPGGVGIAAPQVGVLLRIVIVDCALARHPCRHHGRLCMVNPEIEARDGGIVLGREGCLSVPDWVGLVARHRSVTVAYQDVYGKKHRMQAFGFEARVLQHELDHLDGILFIDRIVSVQDLTRRIP